MSPFITFVAKYSRSLSIAATFVVATAPLSAEANGHASDEIVRCSNQLRS
jgi:hypothetical protein